MEKKKKAIGIVGIFSAIAALGYFLYKEYKKEVKVYKETSKKVESDYNEIGLTKEKFDKKQIDEAIDDLDSSDLTRGLFIAARFGNKFDGLGDLINPNEILDCGKERVIHVWTDTEFNSLVLGFEVPENIKGGKFNEPGIGDYIRCFSTSAKEISEKYQLKVRSELVGYFIAQYLDSDGTECFKSAKIPKDYYSEFANERHDGLTEYIDYVRSSHSASGISLDYLPEFIGLDNVKIVYIDLLFELRLPIQDVNNPGVNLFNGIEILKYLSNEMYISSRNSNEILMYEGIMFHSKDPVGDNNLVWYYDVDESNKVISKDYIF